MRKRGGSSDANTSRLKLKAATSEMASDTSTPAITAACRNGNCPEDRQGLRQAQRTRIQPSHPGQHPPGDPLRPPATSSAGSSSANGRSFERAPRSSSAR